MGRLLTPSDCDRLWAAWAPAEVSERLSGLTAPWYVAAGWALDLFLGSEGRRHGDVEIGVPSARFGEVVEALPGFEWDVAGDGRIWPYPEAAADHHQTWLRDPATGLYRLDVFRETQRDGRWVCRRSASITLPYDELILHTEKAIPYAAPEVALLFKAKALRQKDESDFARVLPRLDRSRRSRLHAWLSTVHPGHPWLDRLPTGTPTGRSRS